MNDEHPHSTHDKLRADLGPEAEPLMPALSRLDSFSAPKPTPADTARLLAALQPALNSRQSPAAPPFTLHPLLLLRTQLRVIREEIWLGSALVLALGVLVTLFSNPDTSSPESLPFVFIAPAVAAIGITFLYGQAVDPALEIELATPISPRLVLLARLTLLFGFNLLLSLIGSGLLALIATFFEPLAFLSFSGLISAWLAPMTFLSALAFLLTVLFFDPLISMTISLLLWCGQILRTLPANAPLTVFAYIPNLYAPDSRAALFALAALMGLIALWIAGREERWLRPIS